MDGVNYRPHIAKIAADDAKVVVDKDLQYGASWCRRGGVGAYMVMIRKVDRIEQRVEQMGYDIFKAVEKDKRAEGIIDDIRDLRGYLLLIEAWLIEQGVITPRYGAEPTTQCDARLNGFVCELPAGHGGMHHNSGQEDMFDWNDHGAGRVIPKHLGDAHGRC